MKAIDEMSFSELLAAGYERDLVDLDAALAAIDEMQAASDAEDAAFAAWIKFERDVSGKRVVHGNVVKAAERRHNRAQYAAIDAVGKVTANGRFPEIAESWGYDVLAPELRAAIVAKRADVGERLDALRA